MSHPHSIPGAGEECSDTYMIIKSELIDSDIALNDHGPQVKDSASIVEPSNESVQEYTDLDSKNIVRAGKPNRRPSARLEQKRTKLKQSKATTKRTQQAASISKNSHKRVAPENREQSDNKHIQIGFGATPKGDFKSGFIQLQATDSLIFSGQTDLLPLSPPQPADSDIRNINTPGEQAILTTTISDTDNTPRNMTLATPTAVSDRADRAVAKQLVTKSCHLQNILLSPGDNLQETEIGRDYIDLDNQRKVNSQDATSLDDNSNNRTTHIHATPWSTLPDDNDQDNRLAVEQENAGNISNARRNLSSPVTGTYSKISDAQFECLSNLIKIIRSGNYNDFSELLERRSIKSNLMNVFVDGHTPLHYSIIYGRSLDWCRQLVLNGADPNLSNRAGWHPIHLAAFNGSRDTMRYLIDCYSDQ